MVILENKDSVRVTEESPSRSNQGAGASGGGSGSREREPPPHRDGHVADQLTLFSSVFFSLSSSTTTTTGSAALSLCTDYTDRAPSLYPIYSRNIISHMTILMSESEAPSRLVLDSCSCSPVFTNWPVKQVHPWSTVNHELASGRIKWC